MGCGVDHFALRPDRTTEIWAMAGGASRATRGLSQPVASGSVSTGIEQSLTGAREHGLMLDAPAGSSAASARLEQPLTVARSPSLAVPEPASCFHCGEPCPDPSLAKDNNQSLREAGPDFSALEAGEDNSGLRLPAGNAADSARDVAGHPVSQPRHVRQRRVLLPQIILRGKVRFYLNSGHTSNVNMGLGLGSGRAVLP